MHIRLETTDGALIAEAEIENGHRLPDVITWQCRCFTWTRTLFRGVPIYREATVYHLNSVESDIKDA